jgi:hypothetical protein
MIRYYIVRVGTIGNYRWLDSNMNPTIVFPENAFRWQSWQFAAREADTWTNGYVETKLENDGCPRPHYLLFHGETCPSCKQVIKAREVT